jgi:hypothetical protein
MHELLEAIALTKSETGTHYKGTLPKKARTPRSMDPKKRSEFRAYYRAQERKARRK